MAASSNRSPSPSSATGRSNPNPRNSEISNNVRRSCSGNPFAKPSIIASMKGVNPVTPANSPAAFPRRHSIGKEGGPPPHHNEKENEKDQTPKPVRIRSPSVPKGAAKNFMSPTISAASKITASPRKKILGERNELIRTSVSSSSDGKGILGSLNIQEVVEDLNSIEPASSDSTVVDPDQREACSAPSRAKEVFDFQVPKSKTDAEFLSESISGIDVCPKSSKPSPSPTWPCRSCSAALDADPSLPPYDPKTNYLSPRPRFLHYKPNPRIEKKIRLGECNRLEDCFTSEIPSDTETSEETQSEKSSCVLLMEGKDEEEEDSEAALAQEKPNVSGISTTEEEEEDSEAALEETDQVKPNVPEKASPVVLMEGQDEEEEEDSEADLEETAQVQQPRAQNSKSHSTGLKPISMLLLLLLLLLLVGCCLWRPISDTPLISSVIEDSSIGKHSSFTKFSEPVELAEFVRANVDALTRNFWLWSTSMVSYFSKMIPSLKEQNESSFLRLGNFTDSVKEQILQCPMKKMIGIFPIKEQGNLISEAYGKAEGPLQLPPEFEDAKMIEEAQRIEPDQLALEQIQEYHAASSSEPRQASQGEREFKESSLSLQDEVVEPHNSEMQQTYIQAEAEHASHCGKPESEESSLSLQDEVVEHHTYTEAQQTEEESKLISHEAELVEVQQSGEPHSILAEAEVVSSHTDQAESIIISEKEQEAQVLHVSDSIESEMPQIDKLHGEVEPSAAAVPEPETSKSFKELCLSLQEKSSNFKIHTISSLIVVLTVAVAASIFAKQQKSPSPSSDTAIPMEQLLVVKKLASVPTPSLENTYQERRLSSRNWPTEVDMMGESCPSEMSSFQKTTSSYSKKESKGVTEAQSQERGLTKSNKRESLASSSEYSTDSPSYGSFTSYEKIHSKHGRGDQEVVTPVRRSSRIRKQVITSS